MPAFLGEAGAGMTNEQRPIESPGQAARPCAVCMEDREARHGCVRCKECWLCDGCIARIQEHGCAGVCPVCRKETPWCTGIPAEPPETCASRVARVSMPAVRCASAFLLLLCMSWVVGYAVVQADRKHFAAPEGRPIILDIVTCISVGILIILTAALIVTLCCAALIGCLAAGVPDGQAHAV